MNKNKEANKDNLIIYIQYSVFDIRVWYCKKNNLK